MTSEQRLTTSHRQLANDGQGLRYSIIVPAYTEGARVGATLERVLAYVAERDWDAEVIAVNDGSSDNTAEIIRGHAEANPRLRLLENPGNRGIFNDTACEMACWPFVALLPQHRLQQPSGRYSRGGVAGQTGARGRMER